ncbi:MAG: exodeoxyribonuclease VII large subunit [Acidimicrobiia bacterium]|nr:exodeoxyribonuclease VII large subunit [Acidimicrobiia bacterium]
MHELERSRFSWHVLLADARVQGEHAERSIATAIRRLEAREVDVIAVVHGGGARTDLAALDTEGVG